MYLDNYRGLLVNTIILSVDLMVKAIESKDKDTVKTTEGSLDDNMRSYLRENGIRLNLEQKYVDIIHELALLHSSRATNYHSYNVGALYEYTEAVNNFETMTGIHLTYSH